ncbi:MAG: hypothetical protein O2816_02390 [Planctomycetota bacterium]|nr:hypothetical protein [Planctomycetota bacterium]
MPTHHPHLARNLTLTYLALVASLSVFAVWPSLALGEWTTLVITMYWTLLLAGIVAVYAVTVVCFGGEDDAHSA